MNKKVLRLIIITISLSMIIISIAGCKGNVKPTNTKKINQEVNKKDLQGQTIKVLDPPLSAGEPEEVFKDGNIEGTKMIERIDNIEKNLNCKIEYVGDGSWASRDTFIKSIMVGEPNADIASVGYESQVQSIEKGGIFTILNDYNDILELDNEEIWEQTATKKLCTIKGYTVAVVPAMRGIELVNSGMVMYFNKSMLEREGVWDEYNLYNMQNEKTWTWETLNEIGTKVTKDKDGDGTIDQIGMIFTRYTNVALNASNSEGGIRAGFYGINENNEAVFFGRDKEKMSLYKFFEDSGATGKGWFRAIDFSQDESEGPKNYFAAAKVAFFIDSGEAIKFLKEKGMRDTLGVVAVPIGPDKEVKDYTLASEGCLGWIMPQGAKNPEGTAYVMKEFCAPLYTKEESEIATETYLSEYIGDEKEIIDTYKMLADPARMSRSMESPFIATWWPSFASYIGSAQNVIEGLTTGVNLNNLWGDPVQTDLNRYWKSVMKGWDKINTERKAQGKS